MHRATSRILSVVAGVAAFLAASCLATQPSQAADAGPTPSQPAPAQVRSVDWTSVIEQNHNCKPASISFLETTPSDGTSPTTAVSAICRNTRRPGATVTPFVGPGSNPGDCHTFIGGQICLRTVYVNGSWYVSNWWTPSERMSTHDEIGHAGSVCKQGTLVVNGPQYNANAGDTIVLTTAYTGYYRWSATAWSFDGSFYTREGSVCDWF
jgi:hypothetical protein